MPEQGERTDKTEVLRSAPEKTSEELVDLPFCSRAVKSEAIEKTMGCFLGFPV